MSYRSRYPFAMAAAVLTLTSCGGGDSSGSTDPVDLPPSGSTPTPTPTPSPTPSPTATPTTVAQAVPGQALVGYEACGKGPVTRDAQGHITGITLTGTKIDNSLEIHYLAEDKYQLDTNGFGGSTFLPSMKQPVGIAGFDHFLDPVQGEFEIFRDGGPDGTILFATFGADFSSGPCFFAAGLQPTLPTIRTAEYGLWIDGLAQIGGVTSRLYGVGEGFSLDLASGTGTITLALGGRADPFGHFASHPVTPIQTVTATMSLHASGTFSTATLSGGGYTGSIYGRLVSQASGNVSGDGGAGAVFVFELQNGAGDMMVGAIAGGAILI